jgi:hypothetical protein
LGEGRVRAVISRKRFTLTSVLSQTERKQTRRAVRIAGVAADHISSLRLCRKYMTNGAKRG